MSRRIPQLALLASTIVISWLGMMAVHETGHVVTAWATGGQVVHVVLHPLTISSTEVMPNPRPLIVVWGGPLVGIVAPLFAWGIAVAANWRHAYLLRVFAGSCLIANGAYLGVGAFDRVGDAGDMLRLGTPIWLLWLFGSAAVPIGLLLWHGQGRHFGLGDVDVNHEAAWGSVVVAVILVGICLLVGR